MGQRIYFHTGNRYNKTACAKEQKCFVDELLRLIELRTPKVLNGKGRIIYDPPTERELFLVEQINKIRAKYKAHPIELLH